MKSEERAKFSGDGDIILYFYLSISIIYECVVEITIINNTR